MLPSPPEKLAGKLNWTKFAFNEKQSVARNGASCALGKSRVTGLDELARFMVIRTYHTTTR